MTSLNRETSQAEPKVRAADIFPTHLTTTHITPASCGQPKATLISQGEPHLCQTRLLPQVEVSLYL